MKVSVDEKNTTILRNILLDFPIRGWSPSRYEMKSSVLSRSRASESLKSVEISRQISRWIRDIIFSLNICELRRAHCVFFLLSISRLLCKRLLVQFFFESLVVTRSQSFLFFTQVSLSLLSFFLLNALIVFIFAWCIYDRWLTSLNCTSQHHRTRWIVVVMTSINFYWFYFKNVQFVELTKESCDFDLSKYL